MEGGAWGGGHGWVGRCGLGWVWFGWGGVASGGGREFEVGVARGGGCGLMTWAWPREVDVAWGSGCGLGR